MAQVVIILGNGCSSKSSKRSEGRPKDATSESLEEGVPEE